MNIRYYSIENLYQNIITWPNAIVHSPSIPHVTIRRKSLRIKELRSISSIDIIADYRHDRQTGSIRCDKSLSIL